jgi:hypothetical protein
LINEPFTPSAVQKELTSCEGECLPGMMGAVEACHPRLWTSTLAKEVKLRVEAVVSALGLLLSDVRSKAQGGKVKLNSARHKEKTLASTGQVWETCDALAALERLGIAGCVTKKAQEYRDMLKDAIEELKEWGEDEDDQDEGFVGSDDEGDNDSIEDMFSGNRLPAHRQDLKELLETSLKKLKLIDILFQALLKRRLKTFVVNEPPIRDEEKRLRRVDDLLARLKASSEAVDDLANAFYELDAEHAQEDLDGIVKDAQATAENMNKSWNGFEDEFTVWVTKWKETISKQTGEKDKTKIS